MLGELSIRAKEKEISYLYDIERRAFSLTEGEDWVLYFITYPFQYLTQNA